MSLFRRSRSRLPVARGQLVSGNLQAIHSLVYAKEQRPARTSRYHRVKAAVIFSLQYSNVDGEHGPNVQYTGHSMPVDLFCSCDV